jgi:hypothetical protein
MSVVDSQKVSQVLARKIQQATIEGASHSIVGNDQSVAYEAGRRFGYVQGMQFAQKVIETEFSRKELEDDDTL